MKNMAAAFPAICWMGKNISSFCRRLQKQRESLLENIKELEAQKPEDPSRDNVLSQIRSVYDVLLDPAAESSTKGNFIRTIVDQIVFDKEAEMVYFDIII